jgi:hypothetical protein
MQKCPTRLFALSVKIRSKRQTRNKNYERKRESNRMIEGHEKKERRKNERRTFIKGRGVRERERAIDKQNGTEE